MDQVVARTDEGAGSGQLERLRQHEQALAELLAEARGEATRLVEEERARGEETRRRLDDEIRSQAEKIRERARLEADEERRRILAEARDTVQRLEGVTDERVAELADTVFSRLCSGEADR